MANQGVDGFISSPRILGGTEEEDRRMQIEGTSFSWLDAAFSACPPNSCRIAERTLSAKSASPRELNRS
jgi:hypothetical protein